MIISEPENKIIMSKYYFRKRLTAVCAFKIIQS